MTIVERATVGLTAEECAVLLRILPLSNFLAQKETDIDVLCGITAKIHEHIDVVKKQKVFKS